MKQIEYQSYYFSRGIPKWKKPQNIYDWEIQIIEIFSVGKSSKYCKWGTGEAIILSMYTNYFDGTVCIGESVYILK